MENASGTPVHPETSAETVRTSADPLAVREGAEAGLGLRIAAFLIDWLVMIGLAIVLGQVVEFLGSVAALGYLLTRDSLPFLNGESLGKKAVKIKAVTESGASLSGNWGPGLVRNAVLIIPFFALVELIVLIVRNGKPEGLRRLGDEWAKTKVVAAG